MTIAHFFDIDTLIDLDNKVWIIDKRNPNIPILKIKKSDFNLIKSGIYKSQGNKIEYNGETFWISTELFNKLKVKIKNNNSSLNNLGISLQEFLNKEIVSNIKPNLNLEVISKLKNLNQDIYIICSSQVMKVYENIIDKVKNLLMEDGILIKKFYFINESFYNQSEDENRYKKTRLVIQHLVGYKTEVNKFIDQSIEKYDEIFFYDNQKETLKVAEDCNKILKKLIDATETGLSGVIKEDIEESEPFLIVKFVTDNVNNRIIEKKVKLEYIRFIKTFESFNLK